MLPPFGREAAEQRELIVDTILRLDYLFGDTSSEGKEVRRVARMHMSVIRGAE